MNERTKIILFWIAVYIIVIGGAWLLSQWVLQVYSPPINIVAPKTMFDNITTTV